MLHSVYKSVEKKEAFRTVYNNILSAMPFSQRTVETPFGETFLLEAGKAQNPAVLLLHFQANADKGELELAVLAEVGGGDAGGVLVGADKCVRSHGCKPPRFFDAKVSFRSFP